MTNTEQFTSGIRTADQKLRVFVSSTIHELQEERMALRKAITDLRLVPVLYEDQGARSNPPRSLYSAWIEQSNICICVYWQSYGWINPELGISGIEDEYDLSSNKPRLIYIKESPDGRDERLEALIHKIQTEGKVSYKTFKSSDELYGYAMEDIAHIQSERFLLSEANAPEINVNYLKILSLKVSKSPYVPRDHITTALRQALDEYLTVVVNGPPGIGKTYTLAAFGQINDCIYISLKNKSTQQVCSYLANQLLLRKSLLPKSFPTQQDALTGLQEQLINSNEIILIDHTDTNKEVTKALLSLEYCSNRIIYATRHNDLELFANTHKFSITAFTHQEIETYLQLQNIELPLSEYQKLFAASKGNPLYLYYFVRYQILPAPEGLEAYQSAIWANFTAEQKDIICAIAISYLSPSLKTIHRILKKDNIQTTTDIIGTLNPVVINNQGQLDLFHPYFKDFVISQIKHDGLDEHYHELIAEYAIETDNVLVAAYHLNALNDERLESFAYEAAVICYFRGDYQLSLEFLKKAIFFYYENGDTHNEALARYFLGNVYSDLIERDKARVEYSAASKLFEGEENTDWQKIVDVQAALLLVDEGNPADAINALKQASDFYSDRNTRMYALCEYHLSYVYLKTGQFREGYQAASHAYELFSQINDEYGIFTSLFHISGFLGQLGDFEQQKQKAEEVIDVARKKGYPRILAGALSNLGMAFRNLNECEKAKDTLEECIRVCQAHGYIQSELINIANLGNVFRDIGETAKARKAYEESYTLAREKNLPRQEGHALELLAKTYSAEKNYEIAINFLNEALKIHHEFQDNIRIASTQYELARIYYQLDDFENSAANFQDSSLYYKIAGLYDDAGYSLEKAESIWTEIAENDKAFICAIESLECSLLCVEPSLLDSFQVTEPKKLDHLISYYKNAIDLAFDRSISVSQSGMKLLSLFVRRNHTADNKLQFFNLAQDLLSKIIEPNLKYASLLVSLIEYSHPDILTLEQLNFICCELARIPHLYHANLGDGCSRWTVGLNWGKHSIIQIEVLSEPFFVHKTALLLALLLILKQPQIGEVINQYGGFREENLKFIIMTQDDFEKNLNQKLLLNNIEDKENMRDLCSNTTASNVPYGEPQPPCIHFLYDTYESMNDYLAFPKNRTFVWFLMNSFISIVTHFAHAKRGESLAIEARKFCEESLN